VFFEDERVWNPSHMNREKGREEVISFIMFVDHFGECFRQYRPQSKVVLKWRVVLANYGVHSQS